MTKCDRCEDELVHPRDKDNANRWRDKCMPCIEEIADSIDRSDSVDFDIAEYDS